MIDVQRAERTVQRAELRAEIQAILTQEQRAELQAMREARRGRSGR
jgi:Spy/CpxP family protein refolding chaperone